MCEHKHMHGKLEATISTLQLSSDGPGYRHYWVQILVLMDEPGFDPSEFKVRPVKPSLKNYGSF